MPTRISVPLEAEEVEALLSLAQGECRQPREEVRFLLREELRRRGLLGVVLACERRVTTGTPPRQEPGRMRAGQIPGEEVDDAAHD